MMKLGRLVIERIQQYLVCTYKLFKSAYIGKSAMELKVAYLTCVLHVLIFGGMKD